MNASLLIRVLAILGVACSLWYAGLHIYWSIFANHLAPLAGMSGRELLLEYVTLAAFYVPKLGVVAGAVAIFSKSEWALRIFGAAWAIAAVHSALWYFSGYLAGGNSEGVVRLLVHHAVPHVYFALMVFMLRRRDRAGMTSNYAMQRSSRVGTPLAGTGPGEDRLRSASGAPSARRR